MSCNFIALRTLVVPILFLLSALTTSAAPVDKATADSLYTAKQYVEAAEMYQILADSVETSDIYYNLGNAEFRQKHYGRAILAYERALRIDPDNEDAQYNIALVRTRISDRFAEPSEMFFISWMRSWISSHSVRTWTFVSYLCFLAIFFCLIFFFVGKRMWLRKVGFFCAVFCALAFVVTTVFAIMQRCAFSNNSDAIILADEVLLYSSPTTSSKQLRVLHEGTTVTVNDVLKDGWLQVVLPDASEGYLTNSQLEFVVSSSNNKRYAKK